MKVLRYGLFWLGFLATGGAEEERDWKNSEGKTIQAKYLSQDKDTVSIQKDGKTFRLKKTSLSQADQDWLRDKQQGQFPRLDPAERELGKLVVLPYHANKVPPEQASDAVGSILDVLMTRRLNQDKPRTHDLWAFMIQVKHPRISTSNLSSVELAELKKNTGSLRLCLRIRTPESVIKTTHSMDLTLDDRLFNGTTFSMTMPIDASLEAFQIEFLDRNGKMYSRGDSHPNVPPRWIDSQLGLADPPDYGQSVGLWSYGSARGKERLLPKYNREAQSGHWEQQR